MLFRKMAWFLGILIGVISATSALLAFLEPGNTNAGELGYMVGRKIFLMLIASVVIYFGAKRMGWILRDRS